MDAHPEKLRKQIVDRYLAGHKMADIQRDTGVSKPTIYAYIRKAGYSPARRVRSAPLHARDLMEQLADAHKEIGRLQSELDHCNVELAKLKQRKR
jgi:transposase